MRTARRRAGALSVLGALIGAGACCPAVAQPPPGRHAGRLCVTTAAAPESCGPVEIDLAPGTMRLRIDDVQYRVNFVGAGLEVIVLHGSMQIDDFASAFAWEGDLLRFEDVPRRTRYEVRFAPADAAAKR